MYRKRFLKTIEGKSHSGTELEDIYIDAKNTLKKEQLKLKKEAFAGKDLIALEIWNEFILRELGIDNFEKLGIVSEDSILKSTKH